MLSVKIFDYLELNSATVFLMWAFFALSPSEPTRISTLCTECQVTYVDVAQGIVAWAIRVLRFNGIVDDPLTLQP